MESGKKHLGNSFLSFPWIKEKRNKVKFDGKNKGNFDWLGAKCCPSKSKSKVIGNWGKVSTNQILTQLFARSLSVFKQPRTSRWPSSTIVDLQKKSIIKSWLQQWSPPSFSTSWTHLLLSTDAWETKNTISKNSSPNSQRDGWILLRHDWSSRLFRLNSTNSVLRILQYW